MVARVNLEAFVGQVQQIAPLPAVALRVMELAQSENSSASDLSSVIATDQAMTAKLLKLANSAYFSAGREIKTVRDAVVLLGMMEVRRLVLTSALMGRFNGTQATSFSVASFWGHALATGIIADVMARHTRLAQPEEAYTAGILHDIGKLIMSQYLKEHFDEASTVATTRGIALEQAEAEVFGFTHALLGSRLAQAWRLPAGLVLAIAEHHNHPGEDHGLSFVVAQANELCRDHGLWCGFEDTEPGAQPPDGRVDDPVRAAVLAKLGGWERVVERASSFVEASPVAKGAANVTPFPAERQPAFGARPLAPAAGSTPRTSPFARGDRFPSSRFSRR